MRLFIDEMNATLVREWRFEIGRVTTGWELFDLQVVAEPTLIALQVWGK